MAYLTSQGYQPYSDPYFQDIGYGASGSQYQNIPMSYAQSGQPQGGAQIAQPPSSYQQLPDWAQKYYGAQMQGIDPGLSSYMQKQFYNDYQMHAQASPNLVDPITGIYTPWAIQQGLDPSVLGAGQYRTQLGAPGQANFMGQQANIATQDLINPWSGVSTGQTGTMINSDGTRGSSGLQNINGVWGHPGNYSQTTVGQGGATTQFGAFGDPASGYAINRR